jgi:putative methyltransferase (TIGR04325 family)
MPRGNKSWKDLVRVWVPPGAIRMAQQALDRVRPAPWEYIPEGWCSAEPTRGWNVAGIAKMQTEMWPAYADRLSGTGPLSINHEDWNLDSGRLYDHNTLVTYAYVLALAARQKPKLSLLDWGGGIGHYYLLSRAVLPEVELDYSCHDVPLLCQAGRAVLPQGRFIENPDDCFSRKYGLVLASSSLWYQQDWRSVLDRLVAVADPYLYVTRMIFVERAKTYVAIQRPWSLGYGTEYRCWIFNREEFVRHLTSRSMELLREFLICDRPRIHRAPEQGDYKGFLFRKRNAPCSQVLTDAKER